MLGPPVCSKCEVLLKYEPNKEEPNRQGRWYCPVVNWHGEMFTTHLLLYPKDKANEIWGSESL